MITKIKIRIVTDQIARNFTHGKEYLVKYSWDAGYTVICNTGDERYVPKGYVTEVIEIPSCAAGEVRGENCDPCDCPEPFEEVKPITTKQEN